MSWLNDQEFNVLPWAPQSPDLNPIEHLWGLIKVQLANKRPCNKKELWEMVQAIWYAVPPEECAKRVTNMSKRIKEVIKRKGNNTRY